MEFAVLGPLLLGDGTRWISPASARDRAFLGELLVHAGEPVTVEHLTEAVWRKRVPADPRNAVQVRISRLRRLLGPGSVANGPSGYSLRAGAADCLRFRELTRRGAEAQGDAAVDLLDQALSLWRGRAFADIPSSPCVDMEAFALEEARLVTFEDWAQASLDAGRHAELVTALRPVLNEHPLRERLRGQLMLALYRSGVPGEALETYRAGHAESVRELGLDPGPELRSLHEAILAGDPALSVPPPSSSVSARQVMVPRQLPAGVNDFVGRTELVGELTRTLGTPADGVPVVAVTGLGGIGKTSVALKAAHQVRGAFPDGQLFADLRGTSDAPRSPTSVLAQFIRALRGDGALPATEDELAVLYRSLLAERRVLVVLDDAADTAQVSLLLPGYQGSAAIVTSRTRLAALDGVQSFGLTALVPDHAAKLFADIVGAARAASEPEATERVLTACGGMPLAIRLIGARLATRPDLSVADMARRLSGSHPHLDEFDDGQRSVRTCLETSYVALPPATARGLRLLGLWDGEWFGPVQFAALADVFPGEAETALGHLIGAHLADAPEAGRYRLHDLVHEYASERVGREEGEPERDAAVRRLLTWYLNAADNARRAIRPSRDSAPPPYEGPAEVPGFADRESALGWLERERANLTALAERAGRRQMHDLVWYAPLVLADVCHLRGYWSDWLALCETGLRAARRLADPRPETVVANLAGVVCLSLRRLDEAIEHFRRAAELNHASGDQIMEGFVLNNLGDAYHATGSNAQAVEVLHRALTIAEQTDSPHLRGAALYNLACVDVDAGRLDEALQRYNEARDTYRSSGRPDAEGQVLTGLAAVQQRLGQDTAALESLRQAVRVHRDAGNRPGQAAALRDLGDAHRRAGDLVQARRAWTVAHELLAAVGSTQAADIRARLSEAGG
ncbi:tetratricopeptide repeat protein [Streptomyces sp. PTM05]|uniref:Tetratricopeptide repeat protein n=1 Tax=Streptantibioticus parmotrematis TaxID=2873249 RepID=A0ABS7QLK9_9ACTN|nr:AfsR/SARP family transcriptional regulator [Streptantibioticus parmotrematis]MBY8884020.1 tetratricopeptide repeat protein [Streptantibioticus parmotrematis]